jgi:hypothetical protein
MASPQILVTGQVPADSPATALAGRALTMPVETIDQMVHRITEARKLGVQPSMQVVYVEGRWNRAVNASAVAAILPTIVATPAEFGGHRTTSQAALIVAVLLASLAGGALVLDRRDGNR